MSEPILIDGSEGEGGGQMLRSALALSLLTQRPFRLINIRANRPKPGLAAQHLASVRAATTIGNATVKGDKLSSREIQFEPGNVQSGDYDFRINTAGATALVLHTVYLPLMLRGQGPSTVRITGGTHVKAAPCFHYLDLTWRRWIERLGASVELRLERLGFHPSGGGSMVATIQPTPRLRPLRLPGPAEPTANAQGELYSLVSGTEESFGRDTEAIAAEQANAMAHELKKAGLRHRTHTEVARHPNTGTMAGCLLPTPVVPSFHFSLGERGKRARYVGEAAAKQAIAHWRAAPRAVDPHAADQLLLPLAFAEGVSRFQTSEVTLHLLTNAGIIGRFVDRPITIEGALGGPGWVEIPA